MGERQRIRRLLRKRTTEVALGLVSPSDHIEAMNAVKGQRELLRLAQKDGQFAWLARRLEGKEVKLYMEW